MENNILNQVIDDYKDLYHNEKEKRKKLQRKIDVLEYIIKHLDYLDIWNDFNTSEFLEILGDKENEYN